LTVKVYINYFKWRGRLEVEIKEKVKLDDFLKLVATKIGGDFYRLMSDALSKRNVDVLPFIIINGVLVARPYTELGQVEVKDGDDVKIWTPVGG
jgi:sulfur carrier protein ThiS